MEHTMDNDGFAETKKNLARMIQRSSLMLVGCSVILAAILVLFCTQTISKFDEYCHLEDLWVTHLFPITILTFCCSIIQEDEVEPFPADKFEAVPTVANTLAFVLLVLPFFFIRQLGADEGRRDYCLNKPAAFTVILLAMFSHIIIALMRFWKGCYYILVSLLVGIVCTSFNVHMSTVPGTHVDSKFVILAMSVLLVSLSHRFFWVRGLEVSQAQDLRNKSKSPV